MTKQHTVEATWEKDANGTHTLIQPPAVAKLRGVLRALAFAKMEGMFAVSADFGGKRASFEPLIEVRIEWRDEVQFMSLYTPALDLVSDEQRLPALCLRRGKWVSSEDAKYFDQASNKSVYAATQQHLDSRIFFRTDDPRMAELVKHANTLFRAGVGLEQTDRPDFLWSYLSIRVRQESHLWNVEYPPRANKNVQLEAWAEDWRVYFEALDSLPGIVPDKNCTAYYELSLADRLRAIASWEGSSEPE